MSLSRNGPPPFLSSSSLAKAVMGSEGANFFSCLLFIVAFLVLWISLKPFSLLDNFVLVGAPTNLFLTYLVIAGLTFLMLIRLIGFHAHLIGIICTPWFILFVGWIFVSLVFTEDLAVALKRCSLALMVMVVAIVCFLLPRDPRQFSTLMAIIISFTLGFSYFGVLVMPESAIEFYDANYLVDSDHKGRRWRGVFTTKNDASAMSVLFCFISLYIARVKSFPVGFMLFVMSLIFLIYSGGKAAMTLAPYVAILSFMMMSISSIGLQAFLIFVPLVTFQILTVGSAINVSLLNIVKSLPLVEITFTGRHDIWRLIFENIRGKIWTGHGYDVFWLQWKDNTTWARGLPNAWSVHAGHSHNSYLELLLSFGLPGLALALIVFAVIPFKDFNSARRYNHQGPLLLLMLQIWLFVLYLSALESCIFYKTSPIWFTFAFAVFGLRFLAHHPSRVDMSNDNRA